jgi:hypothetical protein
MFHVGCYRLKYSVTFEYLPGKKTVAADALSRLDIVDLIQERETLTALAIQLLVSSLRSSLCRNLIVCFLEFLLI